MASIQQTIGLAEQEARRMQSIKKLQQMRVEARLESDRLIRFLDQSDFYVMTELEDDDSCLFEDAGDAEPSASMTDSDGPRKAKYIAASRCPSLSLK